MKKTTACYAFIAIAGFLFYSCNSESDKIEAEFQKVDESLKQANETVDRSLESVNARIDSQMIKINLMYTGKDSVNLAASRKAFTDAINTIRIIKSKLNTTDPGGDKLDVADNIIVNSPLGDSLFNSVTHIYNLGVQMENDPQIKLSYHKMAQPDVKKDWLEQFFKSVPTFTAITLLNKMHSDLATIQASTAEFYINKLRSDILDN